MSQSDSGSFSDGFLRKPLGKWETVEIDFRPEEFPSFQNDQTPHASAMLVTAVMLLLNQYLRADKIGLDVTVINGYRAGGKRSVVIDVSPISKAGDLLQDVSRQIRTSRVAHSGKRISRALQIPCTVIVVNEISKRPRKPIEFKLAKSDVLTVEFRQGVNRNSLRVHYRERAHPAWLIKQFGRHLIRVLMTLVNEPQTAVAKIILLDKRETEIVWKHSLGPTRRYRMRGSLFQLFEERASLKPDEVAVISGHENGEVTEFSNRQLKDRVNEIATLLKIHNVSEGVRVGIYLERSVELVAALLALIRVGGIYVPVDRSYPTEYARFILADTQAAIVIADQKIPEGILPPGVRMINLNDAAGKTEPADLFPEVTPTEPAIIMYTSGSTGRPKGVVHSQRQVINRLNWMWEAYPFREGDVIAQRSPINVMPSIWELLGGVLAGVPTVIIPDAVFRDPVELADFLVRHKVSFITLTPTLLTMLLDSKKQSRAWPRNLRVVIIGGEKLTDKLYRRFRVAFPTTTLVDDFGATEVNTVLHVALPPDKPGNGTHPGYQPISNISAFILDNFMRIVPFGVQGELCIAGPAVALHYLNLEDATLERFVKARPRGWGAAVRLYRTGDLGYMSVDGKIHVTGRRDRQIKINGMRVELGEVEHVLSLHPAVAECAVIARQSSSGQHSIHAFLVSRNGQNLETRQLRDYLKERLPPYMLPRSLEWLRALPRRPNGKKDLIALRNSSLSRPPLTQTGAVAQTNASRIAATIRNAAALVLDVDPESIDHDVEFEVLGFDSVAIVEFARHVSEALDRPLSPIRLFEHPTVRKLTDYLAPIDKQSANDLRQVSVSNESLNGAHREAQSGVAIIGMSGRFPGASDINQFWRNLCEGRESICTTAHGRWDAREIYDPDPSRLGRSYSKWGGFLSGVEEFDPSFFWLSPAESRLMDPQQRLCLMESWRALEDAGYTGQCLSNEIVGVFVGAREPDYPTLIANAGCEQDAYTLLGNDLSLIAARISYFCDLHGPSLVVNTACSSSLVAVHLACRSLIDDESSIAIAGGVCVTNDPNFYVATSKLGIFSPTGQCRAFDQRADGFVHGEGVGFVVLKLLRKAIADGDHIYAVIRGTAVNQDGRSNGITAPNGQAQCTLQQSLYRKLGIDPATITYVEAHGTGTPLGDPVEVQALANSFGESTEHKQYCALGSVKTNIGHLTAASGVAGLIKTTLCLYHRELVPSLHFNQANSLIDFEKSPFYVNTIHGPWDVDNNLARRAAVNAFGIGGTNAHCVLEEAPAINRGNRREKFAYLIPVTAATTKALNLTLTALHDYLSLNDHDLALSDISYTLLVARRVFNHGYVFVAREVDELRSQLLHIKEGNELPCVKLIGVRHADELRSYGPSGSQALADLIEKSNDPELMPDDYFQVMLAIADLIAAGTHADWRLLYEGDSPRRVPLPPYAFARERLWVNAPVKQVVENTPKATMPDQALSLHSGVANVVAQVLGIEPVMVSTKESLSSYGFDSIGVISLKHSLERVFEISVPLELLIGSASIDKIVEYLREPPSVAAQGADVSNTEEIPIGSFLSGASWSVHDEPHQPFPLTDLQAAHFVARHMPESDQVGCHVYLEFPVVDLDTNRLERAWNKLLVIHPMLRARISRDGTQSIVAKPPVFAIPVSQVADGEALAQHLVILRAEMSHKIYQPDDWPLFDIRVTSVAGAGSRVHVSMDSWIVDGASANLLYRQWRLLYDSLDTPLAAPTATFRDFVLSTKAFEGTAGHQRCANYWTAKLQDGVEGPQLPYRAAEKVGAKTTESRRRRLHHVYAPKDWETLKHVARDIGVSATVTVIGVLAAQVHAFGWGDRFGLIMTSYNRPPFHPDIDQIVGPLSSTNVFIVEHRPEMTFEQRLRDYERQLLRDLDHGYMSSVAAMRHMTGCARGLPVVFTSALGLNHLAPAGPSWLDDVDYAVSQTPGVDLHCQVYERADGLHLSWDVREEQFEIGLIQSLFDAVCASLTEIISSGHTDPDSLLQRSQRANRLAQIQTDERSDADDIALTPLQHAHLAHRLINPNENSGLIYREFEVSDFNAERLQAAINSIINSSDVLRCLLLSDKAKLVAFSNGSYPIRIDDLRALNAVQVQARLAESRREMERTLRSAAQWPSFALRASFLDSNRARVQLMLNMLLFDGHAAWLFYEDLFRRYQEGISHCATSAQCQITYKNYAKARERFKKTPAYRIDQLYWERKFQTLPPGPRWPWPTPSGPSVYQRYELNFDRWQVLKNSAEARSLPPVALLLSLYAQLLRRWNGGEALTVVAVTHPNRTLAPDFADMYGDVSSIAWLPEERDDSLTLEAHVRRMAGELARDLLHDWGNPFEALRTIGVQRDDRGTGFPAVLTDCLSASLRTHDGIAEVDAWSATPGVDIDHMVIENEGCLNSFWQVRHDRIPTQIAATMLAEYKDALEALASDESVWLRRLDSAPRLPIKSSTAMQWNDTDADYDREQCLSRLFEQQAERNPNRIALVSDERRMTFAELEREANRMANFLRRHDVGRGNIVGVLLDRSIDMVVTLLAILKAGATYLPLSASDPPSRMTTMLNRAKVQTLVSKTCYAALFNQDHRVVLLDKARELIDRESSDRLIINSRSNDLAYVIFTSGSTGEPKGVAVCHYSVINLIEWAKTTFGFNEDDQVLFINPLTFDLSVFDLFAMLAYGASVRIVGDEDRLDSGRLAQLLVDEPITFWNSAPSYLQFVLPNLKSKASNVCDRRLTIFLSGDWVLPSLIEEVHSTLPNAQIIALGGATEATVWSNYFRINQIDPRWTSIPYGRPIQNARYYILNEKLQPCPVQTDGELYIGGECLSCGYINAPELTASSFLPDPFHERSNMTMYRTGDLARFMPDGNIQFRGRADNRVKIRGFRIELEEVEAALASCGLVSPVAVVRELTIGNQSIIAFGVSSSNSGRITEESFWRDLKELLPGYMIPAQVYALPSLPMTENGKVNRKRLASLNPEQLLAEMMLSETRSEASGDERQSSVARNTVLKGDLLQNFLCSTLAKILSIERQEIQPDTDFSSIGLSSLHFALLSARLADTSGLSISPAKIFHCTSVADIAETLTQRFPEVLASLLTHIASSEQGKAKTTKALPIGAEAAVSIATPLRTRDSTAEEIAVIGIHCIMPQASGYDVFWENLVNGRNCVELVPPERWDWRAYYGDSQRERNVTVVNKAGFIRDIDKFDAKLFGISPREAELIDPRQRLLLQGAWNTLEDAGYRPSAMRGAPVGVFIGAIGDEFGALLQKLDCPVDEFSLTGSGRSFLANRVSYYFGWHGPSETIDTTCSSSLVALHAAVQAMRTGDCSMAMVGGINILIDPLPHLSLAKVGVLSPAGACRTFDASADGYVRGEGIGLVLLKPLRQAERDHDHVYGVITGTGVNHGGRAHALTAPNPRAQAQVIADAYRRSNLSLRQIGYIEAHGTGTPLGDPIEIEGLKEAFRIIREEQGQQWSDGQKISVGSVKANVGHLEAAAGICGLIKLILMLRHRTLPPLAQLKSLNPQIDVEKEPFFFQTEVTPWPLPIDENGHSMPRAAGVSSFGFGGVNAHALIREYGTETLDQSGTEEHSPMVVPLSARTAEQLTQYAHSLSKALRRDRATLRLIDVVFTLRVGREPFNERAAIVTRSLDELISQLDLISESDRTREGIYYGSLSTSVKKSEHVKTPVSDADVLSPHDLAQAWVRGFVIDWSKLYEDDVPQRVALPGHPFIKVRHWPAILSSNGVGAHLLKLLESNEQGGRSYLLNITGGERIIRDHQIDGVGMLPAAGYLTVAGDIAERLYGSGPFGIRQVIWTQPLRFTDDTSKNLRIALASTANGHKLMFSDIEANQAEYASAQVEPITLPGQIAKLDIAALKRRCAAQFSPDECYDRLQQLGITHGASLRVVRSLWRNESEALAQLSLTADQDDIGNEPRLSSAILDGAFQSILLHQVLGPQPDNQAQAYVPFTVQDIRVYASLPRECYVHILLREDDIGRKRLRRYDLTLVKPDGETLLELKACTGLPLKRAAGLQSNQIQLFTEGWQPVMNGGPGRHPDQAQVFHLTVGINSLTQALLQSGAKVTANVPLSTNGKTNGDYGSAVPWEEILGAIQRSSPETIVLWYDYSQTSLLPLSEQLRLGFDTVFDLTQRLIAMRQVNRCQIVVCLVSPASGHRVPILEALSGFARVAQHESPKLTFKLVQCTGVGPTELPDVCFRLISAVSAALASDTHSIEHRFNFETGHHEVRRLDRNNIVSTVGNLPVDTGGVYLITGGAGAIGTHLSGMILKAGAKVALIGRKPIDEHRAALAMLGPPESLQYFQADVTDADALACALRLARRSLGMIRGVFNCAGEAGGGLLLNRQLAKARQIISAKVIGISCVDEATLEDPLDFFVLFSSLASVTGPVGASDYAYANRYADLYADYRNSLAIAGLRRGKALAISWPLWSEGGMRLVPQEIDYIRSKGLEQINSAQATGVLAGCMKTRGGHFLIAYGDRSRFEPYLTSGYPAEENSRVH